MGAPGEIEDLAPSDADMESLHVMRTLRASGATPRMILALMWFPSGRTCSACGTVNPILKRERTWTCPHMRYHGMTGT